MERYYCKPIKRYVCFVYRYIEDSLMVLMVAHTTGEVLRYITIPFPSGRMDCAFINNKDYPWLHNWLIEKDIASPTNHHLIRDGFSYEEFKFIKEN